MNFRNSAFIARKDLSLGLRQKETLLWVFLMPIVFFYFIGTITAGFGGSSSGSKDPIYLADAGDAGFLAQEVARRLEQADYAVEREDGESTPARRLQLPPEFTAKVLQGEKVTLTLTPGEGDLTGSFDQFRVGRAVYTVLADLVASQNAGTEATPESFAELAALPRALSLEVSQAGHRKRIPSGFEQAVPGMLVMFTLIVLLTSGGVGLLVERKQGLLRRLASTPLTRGEIVLGKWGGMMGLGLVQIAFAMLSGSLFFGMDWGPDLWMVCVLLGTWSAMVAALALVLGNVARSEGQIIGIGVVSANVLAALGGCWWPIEVTPAWMQTLAKFIPTGWAMGALHELSIFQNGAASALPYLAIMSICTLALGWVAARIFRFQ